LLEVGEVIESGDEFWEGCGFGWKAATRTVGQVLAIKTPVRRLVKPAVPPAASSVPDPGEGYRLIDKAVDQPESGDEIWNEDHWEVRGHWFDCKAYNKNNVYRRKLPAQPAPVVSVGDRVKVLSGPWAGCTGVVIGLEAYVIMSDWGKLTAKHDSTPVVELDNVRVGGHKLILNSVTVEKLPPVVPEVLYRDLSHGETIRIEDEYLFCGSWLAGSTEPRHVGRKLEKWHVRHRRPVRLQSPGWRYLDAGETVQAGDEIALSKNQKWIQCSDSVGKPLTDDYLEHGVYSIRRKLPANQGN